MKKRQNDKYRMFEDNKLFAVNNFSKNKEKGHKLHWKLIFKIDGSDFQKYQLN